MLSSFLCDTAWLKINLYCIASALLGKVKAEWWLPLFLTQRGAKWLILNKDHWLILGSSVPNEPPHIALVHVATFVVYKWTLTQCWLLLWCCVIQHTVSSFLAWSLPQVSAVGCLVSLQPFGRAGGGSVGQGLMILQSWRWAEQAQSISSITCVHSCIT